MVHTSGVLLKNAERMLTMVRKRAMPLKECVSAWVCVDHR